ncbi:amidohydrolase family protein [Rugosimonospora africana]|uniref:Amidohydrolase n=1 Tax=Rugosimonospora africana TaxID=556532 RepID=A0A8J3QXZ4_9ACTN|nr:amidohydrolase family protein [Rugosimonospora africana]GIH19264.1 amidohydrolase [Rugosimonospora africana]
MSGGPEDAADRLPVIDAHHHFWVRGESHQSWRGPEHTALDRSFRPDDLRTQLAAGRVDRTVLVQSVNTDEENRRLLAYARDVDFVAGVVAWLPLDEPDPAARILDTLRERPEVCGVRCLIGHEDIDWLVRPAALRLLGEVAAAGWAWDVVPVTAGQVRTLLRVVEHLPQLRVVVDHLGRPPVEAGGWQPWARHLEELASAPGVAVKVSVGIDVLTAWPRWDAGQLQRYVNHIAAVFGPGRMMLASNWPVVTLRADYARAWADLTAAVARAGGREESRAALASVRGTTACRWYGLSPDRPAGRSPA